MSNSPIRQWYFYIDDMIKFAEKVIRYTQNLDKISLADPLNLK